MTFEWLWPFCHNPHLHFLCYLFLPVVPLLCSQSVWFLAGISVISGRCAFWGVTFDWPLTLEPSVHLPIPLPYPAYSSLAGEPINFILAGDQCCIGSMNFDFGAIILTYIFLTLLFWPIVPLLCSQPVSYLAGISVISSRSAFLHHARTLTYTYGSSWQSWSNITLQTASHKQHFIYYLLTLQQGGRLKLHPVTTFHLPSVYPRPKFTLYTSHKFAWLVWL